MVKWHGVDGTPDPHRADTHTFTYRGTQCLQLIWLDVFNLWEENQCEENIQTLEMIIVEDQNRVNKNNDTCSKN